MSEFNSVGEVTTQLHVRIPQTTYDRLRQAVTEKHGLGAFVNTAILYLLEQRKGVDTDEIAEAVVRKLSEKLGR